MTSISYKIYKTIRMITAPIGEIVDLVSYNSDILDIGGGRGVIAEEIKRSKGYKSYTIVDIDEKRLIEVKKRLNNIETYHGDALNIVKEFLKINNLFDTIIISDLLYLCENGYTEALILKCFDLLKKDGALIIKEVNWNILIRFQELLSVKILKFTKGNDIYFRDVEHYEKILKKHNMNFAILKFNRLWYPHFIITIKK